MRVFTFALCLSSCCLEQLSVSYYSGLSCVMLESGMKKKLMSMHECWLMKVKWLQICSLHFFLWMFRLRQWVLLRDYKQMVLIDSPWFNIKIVYKGKFCVSVNNRHSIVDLWCSSTLHHQFHFAIFIFSYCTRFPNSLILYYTLFKSFAWWQWYSFCFLFSFFK